MPIKDKSKDESKTAMDKLFENAKQFSQSESGKAKEAKYAKHMQGFVHKKFSHRPPDHQAMLAEFGKQMMLILEANKACTKTSIALRAVSATDTNKAVFFLAEKYVIGMAENQNALGSFVSAVEAKGSNCLPEAAAIATNRIVKTVEKSMRGAADVDENKFQRNNSRFSAGVVTNAGGINIGALVECAFAATFESNPCFDTSIAEVSAREAQRLLAIKHEQAFIDHALEKATEHNNDLPKRGNRAQPISRVIENEGDVTRESMTLHKMDIGLSPSNYSFVFVETSTPAKDAQGKAVKAAPSGRFLMKVSAETYRQLPEGKSLGSTDAGERKIKSKGAMTGHAQQAKQPVKAAA